MPAWEYDPEEVGEDDAEAVEAGSPNLENAVFVLLGVACTVAVIALLVL